MECSYHTSRILVVVDQSCDHFGCDDYRNFSLFRTSLFCHAMLLRSKSKFTLMYSCFLQVTGSSLILCYGLENAVDFISSAIVLWRFYAPELDPDIEVRLQKREKRASVAISGILFFLGIVITTQAFADFLRGMEDPEHLKALLWISTVSIFIFGTMAVIKFQYSVALSSASLHKDGICSLIGTILSGALFVNTLIIKQMPDAWWIDPAVALGCGIAAIIIGLYSIVYTSFVQKVPIFSLSWWRLSSGDGTDEISGRDLGPEDLEIPARGPDATIT